MRELLDGAGELTADQKARSWATVREAIDDQPRRPRLLPAVVAATVVVGATTAAIVVASRPVTDHTMAECRSYDVDGGSITGTEVSIATRTGESGLIDDAIEVCADFWRAGLLRRGVEGVEPPEGWDGQLEGTLPVPPLTGCTRDDGAAVVVVGDGPEACDSAGYAPTEN